MFYSFGYFPLLARISNFLFRRSGGDKCREFRARQLGNFVKIRPISCEKFGQPRGDYNRADERNEEFFPLNNFRSCVSAPFVNVTRPGSCLEVSPVFRFFLSCPLTNRPFRERLSLAHVLAYHSRNDRIIANSWRYNARLVSALSCHWLNW